MKSGWMSWVRTAATGLALAVGLWAQGAGAAEPEVKNVTAAFLWPWTNAVGISFEVTGTVPTNAELGVTAKDVTKNATHPVLGLTGDTGTNEGVHHVVWNLDQQGVYIQSTNVVFTVSYQTDAYHLYCVVDLSGGANAASYPVTYLDQSPSSLPYDYEYKTTKLLLRRIEPGTFMMGSSSEFHNPPHQVTLTKPYYMGVFEVTQKQYELVTGSKPSDYKGDERPVECVSYDMIRGSVEGTNWPASRGVDATSFLGKLRARTGLAFDLPTEAQWEYACRAGTTSYYNNGGNSTNDLKRLGRYRDNQDDGTGGYTNAHTTVGSYQPNAWGLYDMHGNVWEWCLDWYGSLSAGTDPKGASSGSSRVARGGGWGVTALACRSACRGDGYPSGTNDNLGFRLSRNLSE